MIAHGAPVIMPMGHDTDPDPDVAGAVVVDLDAARRRRASRRAWAHLCAAGLSNQLSYEVLFGRGDGQSA